MGNLIFTNVLAGKYQGKIYLVNPKGEEIADRKVFKSVTEIPDPVDLAVVTIPANRVLALIPELKKKKIKKCIAYLVWFCRNGRGRQSHGR